MDERSATSPFHEAAASGTSRNKERSAGPRRITNVYLRHPATAASEDRRLGRLAQLVGLELYSSVLLTRKNRAELTVLAVMLVGVFCFELLAWSFFLNGIFTGGMLVLHLVGSTAAVILGFLFAATILYFERQVITADATRLPRWKKYLAGGTRFFAIVIAGYVVAHAVDLIAFRVPVQQVLHREAVGAKRQVLESDLGEMRKGDARRKELEEDIDNLRSNLRDVRLRRDNDGTVAEEIRRTKESREQVEQRTLDDLVRSELRVVAEGLADREFEIVQQRADRASDAAQSARSEYNQALLGLQALDNQIAELQREELELSGELRHLTREEAKIAEMLDGLESRARRWLSVVAEERPRSEADYAEYVEDLSQYSESDIESWPTEWREPLRLDPPNASFFEKLEKIYDLVFDARGFYRSVFISIHLAVMLIPFLVLAVKWLLLPKEVDAYFSTWHQAFAGDPEARLILSVEEKVRQEKELW